MNFFTAISGIFRGTSVFLVLMRHSLFKALLHLVMFCILCAAMLTVIQAVMHFKDIDNSWSLFNEECGGIQYTSKGILPIKQPEKMRFFSLPGNWEILYLPADYKGKVPDLKNSRSQRGFIWTPSMVVSWARTQSNGYVVVPFIYYVIPKTFKINFLKQEDVLKYIKENSSVSGQPNIPLSILTPSATKTAFTVIMFGVGTVALLVQALLFVSIFSLIFNLIGSRRRGTLKLRDLFVVGTYTTFPPLLIASAYNALELPFLSFNTVFLICFTVFLMYVVSSLENKLAPPKTKDNELDF
ncbi:MAG: hypothetical protein GY750_20605 [Lentisphaerae bacterium]|nr:hypothetical protein [Lentisphaerota bacterium]MCP4103794.1 hypothetical protein [Lentisphaerota bacterium]